MARKAKIFYQNQMAEYLEEGDAGYAFRYNQQYLDSSSSLEI